MSSYMLTKLRILVLKKYIRVTIFDGFPAGHDDNPVRAEYGFYPVRNGDDGAVIQRRFQDLLNEPIRLQIDVCCGLVNTDDLWANECLSFYLRHDSKFLGWPNSRLPQNPFSSEQPRHRKKFSIWKNWTSSSK